MMQLTPAMTTAPTTTWHPSCEHLKRRVLIVAFVGVVCLGYFCIVSKDRSVILKSQSNVAWQPSQTQSTFNHTNLAMKNIFHHEPVNRLKMGKLTSLSDNSADNVIDNGNKRKLTFTSHVNKKEAPRNISDIIHMKPPTFLGNYKNPCWLETVPEVTDRWSSRQKNVSKLMCLPYFMIVGQPKCGTTDFYYALMIHPDVVKCNVKEPHWWTRQRTKTKKTTLGRYVAYFSGAAEYIQEVTRITASGETIHPVVTGEASASTFWDMSYWRVMPENRGYDEPQYMTAHYVKHIMPDVKIMVILRNPIDRLVSDSFYFSFAKTMEMFHNQVVTSVAVLRSCFQHRDAQRCLTDTAVTSQLKARVHLGLYHVFLVTWLKVFPRSQVKVVQLEEYSRDRTSAMNDIFTFLDLDPLPESEALTLQEAGVRNKRPKRKRKSMLNETRILLEQFYRPFNERLASLLGDDKFLWNTSSPLVTASDAEPT